MCGFIFNLNFINKLFLINISFIFIANRIEIVFYGIYFIINSINSLNNMYSFLTFIFFLVFCYFHALL